MKTLLIFTIFCFGSLHAHAKVTGVVFICASQDKDNTYKITALTDTNDARSEKGIVAIVVDEGAKSEYSEREHGKRKHFIKVNSNSDAKTLITIKDIRNQVLATLTTDPLNNHSVDLKSQDLDSPTRTNPDHKTIMKQTNLDAKLTTPGQEIMEQDVSCLITKFID